MNAHDQNDCVTFKEFYENVQKVATFLKQQNFGWNDVACIVTQNNWQFVVSFIAVSLCGGSLSGASYLFTPCKSLIAKIYDSSNFIYCFYHATIDLTGF